MGNGPTTVQIEGRNHPGPVDLCKCHICHGESDLTKEKLLFCNAMCGMLWNEKEKKGNSMLSLQQCE